jgi:hypothetical protein
MGNGSIQFEYVQYLKFDHQRFERSLFEGSFLNSLVPRIDLFILAAEAPHNRLPTYRAIELKQEL